MLRPEGHSIPDAGAVDRSRFRSPTTDSFHRSIVGRLPVLPVGNATSQDEILSAFVAIIRRRTTAVRRLVRSNRRQRLSPGDSTPRCRRDGRCAHGFWPGTRSCPCPSRPGPRRLFQPNRSRHRTGGPMRSLEAAGRSTSGLSVRAGGRSGTLSSPVDSGPDHLTSLPWLRFEKPPPAPIAAASTSLLVK